MTSKKFQELLNLYLDKRITSTELSLLQREISTNPERRRVYEQYCYMHQASRLILRERRHSFLPYFGLMAACLVGIASFVVFNPWRAKEDSSIGQVASTPTQEESKKVILEEDLFRSDPFFRDPTDFYFTLDSESYESWNNEPDIPGVFQQPQRIFFISEELDPQQQPGEFNSNFIRLLSEP